MLASTVHSPSSLCGALFHCKAQGTVIYPSAGSNDSGHQQIRGKATCQPALSDLSLAQLTSKTPDNLRSLQIGQISRLG